MKTSKVWFITGASKGLGLHLAQSLLENGYQVAATSRTKTILERAVMGSVKFDETNFLALETELTNEESVRQSIHQTIEKFGHIDVVVNNAGYGLCGTVEELSNEETRRNFEVNVFAVLNVLRQVLPHLRARRAGHIINISSIAGFAPGLGFSIYSATKFAVEGFSEVLAADIKALGIKLTIVEPGAFRTNFLAPDSFVVPHSPIEDYAQVREIQTRFEGNDGLQMGDPAKAAAAIMHIVQEENPPLHLFLGEDAYSRANKKIEALRKDLETWKETTQSMSIEA